MSSNGLIWAVEHHLWCKNAGELAVLVAIANYVDKDLKGCFAKQSTLATRARCNAKTARTHVHSLAEKKVIIPGDPDLVAHIRADTRPDVWDLNSDLPTDPTTGNFYPSPSVKITRRDRQKTPRATGKNHPSEPGSEPGTESLSVAEQVVRDSGVVAEHERETFINWLKDKHQIRGPGWWKTVTHADLVEHAADWRAQLATATAAPKLPPWCRECGDRQPLAEKNASLRLVEDDHGNRRPCPDCHPNNVRNTA